MRLIVLWIDWSSYHVARFRALYGVPEFHREASGIEVISGEGINGILPFREAERGGLPVKTLLPGLDWADASWWLIAKTIWAGLGAGLQKALLIPGYYNAVGLTAAVWARTHGARSILMTESNADDHPRTWWKERIKSLVVRALFDRAIVGGRRAGQYLISLGFPERHIATGYDVVDNDFYANGTALLRERPAPVAEALPERYFLYVGRLAPEKNLPALLREFSSYRSRGGAWDLVLVGQGPLETDLREQTQRLACAGHIHFTGFKQGAELLPPYAFASCFVLPSTREPWGLVVNEAMASRLPVIVSTRCGCSDDLVEDGENGFLFDPGRENELAECMLRMNTLNQSELARMGVRSREIISNYSLDRWAAAVVRLAGAAHPETAAP